jgi:sugar (pentulose or hexulose) kinase
VRLRVSLCEPDELGHVHGILTRDDYLSGPIVGIFAVESSLAHTLPADLAKYAQQVVDGLERPPGA